MKNTRGRNKQEHKKKEQNETERKTGGGDIEREGKGRRGSENEEDK
jgi:hypothetical protein